MKVQPYVRRDTTVWLPNDATWKPEIGVKEISFQHAPVQTVLFMTHNEMSDI